MQRLHPVALTSVAILLLTSCGRDSPGSPPRPSPPLSARAPVPVPVPDPAVFLDATAAGDYDDDGDVDFFQLQRRSPVAVAFWRNEERSGANYLRVMLNGSFPNTQAAGARISATIGSRTMIRDIVIGHNSNSQNSITLTFALGTFSQVDTLRVQWPDGQETIESNVAAGQLRVIDQPP